MSTEASTSVTLSVADGTKMSAYVVRPKGVVTAPAIMVFQEAFGVNQHIRDVANRFASLGLVAVAPELFHRTGSGVEGSYTNIELIRPHMAALTPAGLDADIDATYAWITDNASIDSSRIAAVGFCMGGRVSYMANARVKLRAAISFYGGGIAPDLLALAKEQSGAILMFWGGKDAHVLPEHYRAVADALQQSGAIHEQVVFGDADHGFFCDLRASYHPVAARQAWALTHEFLRAYDVLGV